MSLTWGFQWPKLKKGVEVKKNKNPKKIAVEEKVGKTRGKEISPSVEGTAMKEMEHCVISERMLKEELKMVFTVISQEIKDKSSYI